MKNPQFNVFTHVLWGIDCAHVVVSSLMYHSMWFTITPLPDDEWEVMVKAEDRAYLERMLKRCL